MEMTDQEIKKYAKKYYYELKHYKGNDPTKCLNQLMNSMRKHPIKYLEKQFKKILTEPRLPKEEK